MNTRYLLGAILACTVGALSSMNGDAAQTAAITAMANALGRIDAAVDVDALVATVRAAVTEAVESIDVRLDVADTPK